MTSRFFFLLGASTVFLCYCSAGWDWMETSPQPPPVVARTIYSPLLVSSPSNSHFVLGYVVASIPHSVRVSYSLQRAEYRPETLLSGWTRQTVKKRYFVPTGIADTLSIDFSHVSDRTKYVCIELFHASQTEKNYEFRLAVTTVIQGGDIHFGLPEFKKSCDVEKIYTADCRFDGKDSCGFRNDACGFLPWKIDGDANDQTNADLALLRRKTTYSCPSLINVPAMQLSGFTEMVIRTREKRSEAKRTTSSGYGLSLSPDTGDKNRVVMGAFNTPTLTYHPTLNKAMRFTYRFYSHGVHQIVVSLLCVSGVTSQHIRLRRNANYDVTNFAVKTFNLSGRKCLNLHAFLGGCTQFQVQFTGGTRGSKLVVDNIYFYQSCSQYDNM